MIGDWFDTWCCAISCNMYDHRLIKFRRGWVYSVLGVIWNTLIYPSCPTTCGISLRICQRKEKGDWGAGSYCTWSVHEELGVGGRPFCPVHNRRSNRGTHFQVVNKQQEYNYKRKAIQRVCMKGVVSKGERQRVKWRHGSTHNKGTEVQGVKMRCSIQPLTVSIAMGVEWSGANLAL